MISTQSYSRPIAIERKEYQPAVLDRFDKLLLRAAKSKRKDMINRYGQEGFDKLVAKGKPEGKDETEKDPALLKKKYEETIKNLFESFEQSPLTISPTPKSPHSNPKSKTTSMDPKVIESAWTWNLTKSPDVKSRRKRAARQKRDSSRSRRLSLELRTEPISSSDDSCDLAEGETTERKLRRNRKQDSSGDRSRGTSQDRTARRSRRKEAKIANAKRANAIEEVERQVAEKKNDNYQRRGSVGSNIEATQKIRNVRQAVRYWEGRQCVIRPQRRMSH